MLTDCSLVDAFKGLYKEKASLIKNPQLDLPMIHCHCFSKSESPETELIEVSLYQWLSYTTVN